MSYIPDTAFLAGSVGAGEWIILFAVVLVVVGPRRLPEVARKFGRTMEMFRRAADEFKEQLMSMDQEINKNVSDSAGGVDIDGVDGNQAPADPYKPSYNYDAGAYDHASDYPGNEDAVAEWNSDQEPTALNGSGPAESSSETPESADCSGGQGDASSTDESSETPSAASDAVPEPVKEKS